MDIKKIVKEKRFKNTVITLLEILIVAGIIFGALMFIQNKVTSEADKASKLSGKGVEEETENKKTAFSDRYYIEVNKKLKAVIVYQYSKDKKTKVAVKLLDAQLERVFLMEILELSPNIHGLINTVVGTNIIHI